MKLRIRGNTLRLRLSRPEIDVLAGTGMVEDAIRFGPAAVLRYRIEGAGDATTPTASFDQTAIVVRISNADKKSWTGSELVGIYGRQIISEGDILEIALEKDFACLETRSAEDDSKSFPNPKNDRPR